MARDKSQSEKLFGAAVLKMSFALRDSEDSPAFKAIYPGVLRDLGLTDEEVDAFVDANRESVERAARGSSGPTDSQEAT